MKLTKVFSVVRLDDRFKNAEKIEENESKGSDTPSIVLRAKRANQMQDRNYRDTTGK